MKTNFSPKVYFLSLFAFSSVGALAYQASSSLPLPLSTPNAEKGSAKEPVIHVTGSALDTLATISRVTQKRVMLAVSSAEELNSPLAANKVTVDAPLNEILGRVAEQTRTNIEVQSDSIWLYKAAPDTDTGVSGGGKSGEHLVSSINRLFASLSPSQKEKYLVSGEVAAKSLSNEQKLLILEILTSDLEPDSAEFLQQSKLVKHSLSLPETIVNARVLPQLFLYQKGVFVGFIQDLNQIPRFTQDEPAIQISNRSDELLSYVRSPKVSIDQEKGNLPLQLPEANQIWTIAQLAGFIKEQGGIDITVDNRFTKQQVFLSAQQWSVLQLLQTVCAVWGYEVRQVGTKYFLGVSQERLAMAEIVDYFERAEKSQQNLLRFFSPALTNWENSRKKPFQANQFLEKQTQELQKLPSPQQEFINKTLPDTLKKQALSIRFILAMRIHISGPGVAGIWSLTTPISAVSPYTNMDTVKHQNLAN